MTMGIQGKIIFCSGDVDVETGIESLIEEIDQISTEPSHRTILYNDEHHFFDDVVYIVHLATGKSLMEAHAITMEAHNRGRAICYAGEKDRCVQVAEILGVAGLKVEVD